MPHVNVKLWPGKTEEQKQKLAEKISADIQDILGNSADSISVSFEEVAPAEWSEKVYQPEIVAKPEALYKKPGYSM